MPSPSPSSPGRKPPPTALSSSPLPSSPSRLRLEEAFGGTGRVQETGLLIEKEKCNGCGDCVVVCHRALDTVVYHGHVSSRESQGEKPPPVLEVIDGVVQVINWSSCKRMLDPPNLCRVCEEKCPFGALELVK